MAGNQDSAPSAVATPDYSDPFPGIQATLDEIRETLAGLGRGTEKIIPFAANGQALPTSQRWHTSILVFSVSAAATVTLTIGSSSRSFVVPAGDTRVIPYPASIERGVDIALSTSAGAVTGYLIGNAD